MVSKWSVWGNSNETLKNFLDSMLRFYLACLLGDDSVGIKKDGSYTQKQQVANLERTRILSSDGNDQ